MKTTKLTVEEAIFCEDILIKKIKFNIYNIAYME